MDGIPLGLSSALSASEEALQVFSNLPYEKQQTVIEKAKNAHSRKEMRQIVDDMKTI